MHVQGSATKSTGSERCDTRGQHEGPDEAWRPTQGPPEELTLPKAEWIPSGTAAEIADTARHSYLPRGAADGNLTRAGEVTPSNRFRGSQPIPDGSAYISATRRLVETPREGLPRAGDVAFQELFLADDVVELPELPHPLERYARDPCREQVGLSADAGAGREHGRDEDAARPVDEPGVVAGVRDPASLVGERVRPTGEVAAELAAIADVQEQVEQVARVRRRERGAVPVVQGAAATGREVDVRQQPREVEGARVLAARERGLALEPHRDRREQRRPVQVAAAHPGIAEPDAA